MPSPAYLILRSGRSPRLEGRDELLRSGFRLGPGEEGEFLRRRRAAEDRVAVREAAEALDHIDVGQAIPPVLAVLRIAPTRQSCGQRSRALLVGEVLAVVQ